ncbi:Rho GTPase activation protein [Lentinula raphanica]|nr:Rho GTPase activation protein [Lentinula raphanica]
MGYEGDKAGIPRVVKDSIQYLRESRLEEEGLFRRSPSSAMLRAVQEAYNRGNVVSLETFGDRHLAAVLLKKSLKDLPTPLFPETMYGVVRRCPAPTGDLHDMASVMYVRDVLLPELAPCTYILLNHVLPQLSIEWTHTISRSSFVLTSSAGRARYETYRCTSNPTTASLTEGKTMLGAVIKLCIERYYEIFDEVVDPGEMNNDAVLGHDEDEYSHHDELGLEYDGHTLEQSRSRSMSRSRELSGEQLNDDLEFVSNAGKEHPYQEFVRPSTSCEGNHKRNSSGFRTNPDDDEEIDDVT